VSSEARCLSQHHRHDPRANRASCQQHLHPNGFELPSRCSPNPIYQLVRTIGVSNPPHRATCGVPKTGIRRLSALSFVNLAGTRHL
jgi:hypothetical protein